jgi:hypothetical protein
MLEVNGNLTRYLADQLSLVFTTDGVGNQTIRLLGFKDIVYT